MMALTLFVLYCFCFIAAVQSVTLPTIIAVGSGNENERFAATQLQTQLAKSNFTCTIVTPKSANGKAHIAVGYEAGLCAPNDDLAKPVSVVAMHQCII